MSDDSLMLEILKDIRAALTRIEDQQNLHTLELRAIHSRDGARQAENTSTTAAIGDLQDRMRRIEKRLDLNDA